MFWVIITSAFARGKQFVHLRVTRVEKAQLMWKALAYLLIALLAMALCRLLFLKTDILAYRLVAAFLLIILISNLGATFAVSYIERHH